MRFGHQVCTFHLDPHLCGLEAQNVQEVVEFADITPVPLAPAEIRGLANLRGQIVTVLDLRKLLGSAPGLPAPHKPVGIIVRGSDDQLSLIADRIGEVITVDEAAFEPPPQTLTGRARECIRGAYKLERQLLLMLDLGRIITLDLRDLAAPAA